MFELLNPPAAKQQEDPVTPGETLSVYIMFLTVAFASAALGVAVSDESHGLQLAMLTFYSGMVFISTFFRTRGVTTRYRLSTPYVRRQLPRLLLIHGAYLLVLYVAAGWALTRRPELPEFVRNAGFLVIGISEVVLSRTLLGRAKRSSMSSMAPG